MRERIGFSFEIDIYRRVGKVTFWLGITVNLCGKNRNVISIVTSPLGNIFRIFGKSLKWKRNKHV